MTTSFPVAILGPSPGMLGCLLKSFHYQSIHAASWVGGPPFGIPRGCETTDISYQHRQMAKISPALSNHMRILPRMSPIKELSFATIQIPLAGAQINNDVYGNDEPRIYDIPFPRN